jgi:A/G-specific adenine glycosylase
MPRKSNAQVRNVKGFQQKILSWFKHHQRDLPWRKTTDPYAIMVSEIMLQQTQVERVIPKYQAFLEAFPSWQELAKASQADVVRLWHGLGYNRRALGLHKLAKAVVAMGELPSHPDLMMQLPGIGPYTSQAVAAFAFKQPQAAPVDTNIERIIKRVFTAYALNKRELAALARELVPVDSWTWNHALMDFGATVCTARSPECASCPLQDICAAYPCDGTDIQKAKQSTFKDSDRFYRGQLISYLRQHNVLRRNNLGTILNLHDDARLTKILDGLCRDGFIDITNDGKIRLQQ